MMSNLALQRYHSLDSLRAVMMSLGIVLHGALSYMTFPPSPAWGFRDPERSAVFDFVVFFIHVFRMPAFFVVAGFFAAFLYLERGEHNFIRNRLKRVLLPMAVYWPILFPTFFLGFWFSQGLVDQRTAPTLGAFFLGGVQHATFIHMWFLYDLVLFYAVTLILVRIPIPSKLVGLHDRVFRAVLKSPFRALALGLISMITLFPMVSGGLDTRNSYIPYLPGLIAYGVYFGFGWMIYRARDLLDYMQKGAWVHMGLGLALFPVNTKLMIAVALSQPNPDPMVHTWAVITSGVTMGLLVFGFIGLFMRYLNSYNPVMRYITDASYWIYLMHLPFAIWIPGLLVNTEFSAFTKFLIVELVMTTFVLVSYHYFVRSTFLGEMLNGRRYPRSLPPLTHVATPEPAKANA